MKIGIMTFWESINNYGQILQLYALQTYLKKRNHDVFAIKFHRIPPVEERKPLLHRIKYFSPKKFIENRAKRREKERSLLYDAKRGFVDFKQKHISFGDVAYRSLEDLKKAPPVADAYVCGSDQIWNNSFKVSAEPFMLCFGDKNIKRIAYAASFGHKELPVETQDMFRSHIGAFDAVSVREESGLEICRSSLAYQTPYWVPDPTLLFNKAEWINLLDLKPIKAEEGIKQIFIYTLGNSKIGGKQKFIDYAKGLSNTRVFHASANNDFSGNTYPSIYEWLNMIAGSDLIITTSFHGMVFSIIFNRNFIILPNTGAAEGMNERIDSLLGKLDLKDHIMHDFDADKVVALCAKKVDWDVINAKLLEWSLVTDKFFKQHGI